MLSQPTAARSKETGTACVRSTHSCCSEGVAWRALLSPRVQPPSATAGGSRVEATRRPLSPPVAGRCSEQPAASKDNAAAGSWDRSLRSSLMRSDRSRARRSRLCLSSVDRVDRRRRRCSPRCLSEGQQRVDGARCCDAATAHRFGLAHVGAEPLVQQEARSSSPLLSPRARSCCSSPRPFSALPLLPSPVKV